MMGALATHARMLEATLPRLPLVTAKVRQPDERLMSILLSERPMTDEEAAYVAAREAEAE